MRTHLAGVIALLCATNAEAKTLTCDVTMARTVTGSRSVDGTKHSSLGPWTVEFDEQKKFVATPGASVSHEMAEHWAPPTEVIIDDNAISFCNSALGCDKPGLPAASRVRIDHRSGMLSWRHERMIAGTALSTVELSGHCAPQPEKMF